MSTPALVEAMPELPTRTSRIAKGYQMRVDFPHRLNAPAVASQTLEGETILIHFDTGSYFSCNAAGTAVLEALSAGLLPRKILELLPDPTGNLAQFIQSLVDEALIVESTGAGATDIDTSKLVRMDSPSLEKFTDLQEMLLLDPIHEVDTGGWPVKAAPKSS